MPAVSKAQQITAAIAEHHPEKLHARNRGMLSMKPGELHKYASTPRSGLPRRKRKYVPTTDDAAEALMKKGD